MSKFRLTIEFASGTVFVVEKNVEDATEIERDVQQLNLPPSAKVRWSPVQEVIVTSTGKGMR